jgi:hypothetical protein
MLALFSGDQEYFPALKYSWQIFLIVYSLKDYFNS